jgi:hypothetical protein
MKIVKTFPFSGKKFAKESSKIFPNKLFLDEYYFLDEKFLYYEYFFTYFKFFNISKNYFNNVLSNNDSLFLAEQFDIFNEKLTFFKLKYNLTKHKYKNDPNVFWLCSSNFLPELFSATVDIKTLLPYELFENKFKKYYNSVYDLYYSCVAKEGREKIIKVTELACTVYKHFFSIKEDIYDLKFSYDMDFKCIENTNAKELIVIKNNLVNDNIL